MRYVDATLGRHPRVTDAVAPLELPQLVTLVDVASHPQVLDDLHRTSDGEDPRAADTPLDQIGELAFGVIRDDQPQRPRRTIGLLDGRELAGRGNHLFAGGLEVWPVQIDPDDETLLDRWPVQGDAGGIRAAAEELVAHVGHDLTDGADHPLPLVEHTDDPAHWSILPDPGSTGRRKRYPPAGLGRSCESHQAVPESLLIIWRHPT